jgi:hypothetical protein
MEGRLMWVTVIIALLLAVWVIRINTNARKD